MPELIVAGNDGAVISRHSLAHTNKLTIGRSPHCDVTLQASSISRHHAILFAHEDSWCFLDTGSTTGAHNDDGPVNLAIMTPDVWIRIGPAYLWFSPGSKRDSISDILPDSGDSDSAIVRGANLRGLPLFQTPLINDQKCFTIGRSESCQITLSDPGASRLHAVFYLEDTQWYIADANSAGGTLYDGRRITRKRLRDGGFIRIGETILSIHIGDSDQPPALMDSDSEGSKHPPDLIDDPEILSSFLDQAPSRPSD